jgi:hypothetical protein
VIPDPQQIIAGHHAYAVNHYRIVIFAVVLEVIVALLASYVWHTVLVAQAGGAHIHPVSAWTKAFRIGRPKNHDFYARVRLNSGTVYHGRVLNFSADIEVGERELILGQPMSARFGGAAMKPVPPNFQRVVIRESEIAILSVGYLPTISEAVHVKRKQHKEPGRRRFSFRRI